MWLAFLSILVKANHGKLSRGFLRISFQCLGSRTKVSPGSATEQLSIWSATLSLRKSCLTWWPRKVATLSFLFCLCACDISQRVLTLYKRVYFIKGSYCRMCFKCIFFKSACLAYSACGRSLACPSSLLGPPAWMDSLIVKTHFSVHCKKNVCVCVERRLSKPVRGKLQDASLKAAWPRSE